MALPLVLYNIPGRTAKNIEPETICRIADACPDVVAVKESTGNMDQASQILSGSDLTVLSGDDSMTLPLCRDMLGLSTNPIPVKAAMNLIGRNCGDVRLPLCPLDTDQLESLRRTLTEYGLNLT